MPGPAAMKASPQPGSVDMALQTHKLAQTSTANDLTPHAFAGKPSPHDEEHQRSSAAMLESRSHADLLQLSRADSIKTVMENINLSFGRTSSRNLPGRFDRERVPPRRGHRKTVSTIGPRGEAIKPIARTNSAPSLAPSPSSGASWDKLPGELRNRIYCRLLADSPAMMDLYDNRIYNMTAIRDRKPYLKSLPGLAYVNRRTYSEFTTFLLENKTLEIRQKGWNSVTSVHFRRFSDLATSPARTRELLDCITRCRNAERVTLQVKLDLLHMPNESAAYRQLAFLNGTPGVKSAEQVAANYELSILFDLPHLRKFTMICEWHRQGPIYKAFGTPFSLSHPHNHNSTSPAIDIPSTAPTSALHSHSNHFLGQVTIFAFGLKCLGNVNYLQDLLGLQRFPNLRTAITSLSFPNFHQFPGICNNHRSNPYLDLAARISGLKHLSLGFHTASLTTSIWKEREHMQFEKQGEIQRSKELRPLSVQEVADFYNLDQIFALRAITVIHLTCVDSEPNAHFVKTGNAVGTFNALKAYLEGGFLRQRQRVQVNLSVDRVPYT
ncbi:hypothetical protein BU23DRAFT_572696 [Bimuria novae-zelandiae CBS 107.79]|uniref:F-box domain-containing protein n=1 Tax=Bimuria novae-zelandiae CBS 107.79 TaxID=1447943 RepID=A0A6A5UYT0_9PLEO|nr:hypothetical protein BU23DRAFT_572696 [Bimuria novae-zelandiae CBS 107.79]